MICHGQVCKFEWGEPAETRMRSILIVVDSPIFNDVEGIPEAAEQMLVEAFISQAAIKRFNEAVLHRLDWGDVVSFDAAVLLPFEHGV